jgi:hypothetical protein
MKHARFDGALAAAFDLFFGEAKRESHVFDYALPAMKLQWSKAAGDVWSFAVGPFTAKVAPKGDGRWNWQVFQGGANPTAQGVASSLGAAKTATENFVKRSGLI